MRFKIFKANIDKKNSLDPYNDFIKDSAKLTPISSDFKRFIDREQTFNWYIYN